MRICGVQFNISWEDQNANRRRIEALLSCPRPTPGSLVVLPEMCTTGFTMNAAAAVTPETMAFFAELASRLEVYLVAGVARREPNANEAVVFGPDGRELVRYRKQRPFAMGGEDKFFEAGDSFALFDWQGCQVAPFICYDLRFPELFRPAVAAGAELIVVMASWPARRIIHWIKLLQARAIENQCHVIGVNRIGDDPYNCHCGRSLIVDPMGEIFADAGEVEAVITADIDIAAQRTLREKLPFLRDMR